MSTQMVFAYIGPTKVLLHELKKSGFKHGNLRLADEADRQKVHRPLARESRRAKTMRILDVASLRNGGIA